MNIAVLAGGNSTERNVSLVSGKGVYEALKSKGHKAVLIDVYLGVKDVDVENVFDDTRDWAAGIDKIGEENPDLEELAKSKPEGEGFFGANVLEICRKADICFLALHGANGEDGRIQATFDLMGIKYTGTGYLSSAICMDKDMTKKFFVMGNIPTPASVTVTKKDDYAGAASLMGYPVVVKTCFGGSSIGVFIVSNEKELDDAVAEASKYAETMLVEKYIKGREFTCGVIEGKALPIVEIAPKEGFYDYKNKYKAGAVVETCPAQIDEKLTEEIQKIAVEAFNVLGLKNYARIDFMTDENGNVYCLEANTLPGMTPTSLIPQEAAVIGMDYPTLCDYIIEISLKNAGK